MLRVLENKGSYTNSGIEWLGTIPDRWSVVGLKRVVQAIPTWKHLQVGDLLIQTSGDVGKVRVHQERGTTGPVPAQQLALRMQENWMDSHYLAYLLQTGLYQGYISSSLVTGVVPHCELSREGMMVLPIICPELEEQQAIVSFLDREMLLLEDLIAKKEQLIQLLIERRRARVAQLLTREGEAPPNWGITRLKYAVQFLATKRISTPDRDQLIIGENAGKRISFKPMTAYEGTNPDFVLKVKQGDVQFWVERLEQLSDDFFVADGTQPVTMERLGATEVCVPTKVKEQRELGKRIAEIRHSHDHLLELLTVQVGRLREYREAFITAAVTGKIDVK